MAIEIKRVLELNDLAKQEGARYSKQRRLYMEVLRAEGRAFTGIVGPRGVGKTVLLRQLALEVRDSFYLSLDALGETDLFALAKTLAQRYGAKLLLLDEIHFCKGYGAALKSIYDFLRLRVVFTSSVALSLQESAHDLSRRVRMQRLYPFSFAEYLRFREAVVPGRLTLGGIAAGQWAPEHERCAHLFDEYLQGGLFPFALEEAQVLPVLENILEKVISRDIPTVANLRADEIEALRKTMRFIGKAAAEDINYSSISRNVGITKYKAEQYVRLLDQSFILNPVLPAGTNVLKEPKVLMRTPFRLLYRDYEEALGGLREDFAAETLRACYGVFHYLKSTRGEKTPDFLVEEKGRKFVIEIGGKGKGRRQFKGLRAPEKLVFSHASQARVGSKPLFLLGFIG
ncbi:ATP-binding protein [Elusimicrobiota bacterium]